MYGADCLPPDDKRRTELTGLKEINPFIENIYIILKYDDQQNFRRIPSKQLNSVRYHLLENPEILEDFRRKFKKKKAIRKQSHESSASLNAVSASVEGDTYTRTLQRRYDLEYLPDLDPNFEELDSYKKKGEFGQLIPKNSEVQEDIAPQSDDGNGPRLEPEISQNGNLEPKSIFGESLPIIKSAEVEAFSENIVKKKYLKEELVEPKKELILN
ncbi:unnamed protein product [Spodoptera exigua]|nr:unnamed protein product [Spodoptera exigua]